MAMSASMSLLPAWSHSEHCLHKEKNVSSYIYFYFLVLAMVSINKNSGTCEEYIKIHTPVRMTIVNI